MAEPKDFAYRFSQFREPSRQFDQRDLLVILVFPLLTLIVFLVEFMILLRFPSNVSVCVLFSLLFTDIGTMIRVVFHLQIKLIPLPFLGSGMFFC